MLMGALTTFAQQGYWFKSKFIELLPTENNTYFVCKKGLNIKGSDSELKQALSRIKGVKEITPSTMNGFLINTSERPVIEKCYVSPCYRTKNTNCLMVLPEIALRLNDGYSIDVIMKKYGDVLKVNKNFGNCYRLLCDASKSDDVLQMLSMLNKEDAIEWCEPNILAEVNLCNTYYNLQYYLKNTGQTYGTPGIDINVEPAWQMITGSQYVTVAVIDTGVDDDHEDMLGCVLEGYTAGFPDSIGHPQNATDSVTKFHGTACAGIIAANNNSIGIRGVAHGVKILPVNIFPYLPSNSPLINNSSGFANFDNIADAIRWAYARADILSCSWISDYNGYIANAINEAETLGRTGKGCVVVCAAGNDYDDIPNSVSFPASLASTISVGALNKFGNVCNYSQRNQGLDIVAIGGDSDIVTLDRMGALGVGPTNYIMGSGTSFACPQVSGVAALMLSINPNLTATQVRNILKNTCKKLPAFTYNIYGWSNQVGFGLLDAEAAILSTIKTLIISGPDIPEVASTYYIPRLPSICSVAWSWKSGNTTVPITQNSPSVNQCTINNSSKEYIVDTLVAVVSKNGNTIATIEKAIDTGAGFYGTYEQEGADYISTYVPECPPTSFHSGDRFTLYKGPTITLWSPNFVGATFSFAGNGSPSNWTHNGNTISFKFRYLPPAPLRDQDEEAALRAWILGMQVTGRYTNSYKTFRFTIRPMLPMLVNPPILLMSSSGNSYTFTPSGLNDEDSMSANNRSWDLLVTNTLTGRVMYSGSIRGASHTIDTSSWEEGVYAVQARVGETVLTQKFSVSK